MSLTSFLQIPSVRARFKQEWPAPTPRPQTRFWPMVAPPISPRPPLIGVAFDYVMRFHLHRLNPSAQERDHWITESAFGKLKGRLRESAEDVCKTARMRHQLFLDGESLNDDLLSSALQLAQLDFVFRSGQLPASSEFVVFQEDIADLQQLVEVCDWSQWRASRRCRLNPDFGTASTIVVGADADFQIDTTLYELKTVRRAALSLEHYHQLIGYSILNFLDNGPPIDELAIYYSRFAQTVRWPTPRWNNIELESCLLWVCRSADEAFGSGVLFSEFHTNSVHQPQIEALASEVRAKHGFRRP